MEERQTLTREQALHNLWWYRDAVETVALPADEQLRRCLDGPIPVGVDEIMMSLDDAIIVFEPNVIEHRLVPDHVIGKVHAIMDRFLSWTDRSLWQDEGLIRSEWEVVRQMAVEVLAQIPPGAGPDSATG